jgi:hypothetical protein
MFNNLLPICHKYFQVGSGPVQLIGLRRPYLHFRITKTRIRIRICSTDFNRTFFLSESVSASRDLHGKLALYIPEITTIYKAF